MGTLGICSNMSCDTWLVQKKQSKCAFGEGGTTFHFSFDCTANTTSTTIVYDGAFDREFNYVLSTPKLIWLRFVVEKLFELASSFHAVSDLCFARSDVMQDLHNAASVGHGSWRPKYRI